ncbi:hypothetical protein H5410_013828 [Solanum commersonii]|uniref:Uncharacterized protein n=1 Tax=Solanum commersonii TaxID=4109 RepID=A0A9J5ZPI7_SOLCO|nr:hypothetical protein H5410_013828 [Solanum commersonii]
MGFSISCNWVKVQVRAKTGKRTGFCPVRSGSSPVPVPVPKRNPDFYPVDPVRSNFGDLLEVNRKLQLASLNSGFGYTSTFTGKRPMSERKNNRGGGSSSNSKNLPPPRFRINTNDYTHVDETSFTRDSRPIEFNSENEVDHETLNRCFTNFEEELDEEVEINEEDDETPTPTSPATESPEQDEVPSLPTFSKTVEKTTVTCTKCKLIMKHVTTGTQGETGRTHLRKCNKEFARIDDIERANRNGIPISENSMGAEEVIASVFGLKFLSKSPFGRLCSSSRGEGCRPARLFPVAAQ